MPESLRRRIGPVVLHLLALFRAEEGVHPQAEEEDDHRASEADFLNEFHGSKRESGHSCPQFLKQRVHQIGGLLRKMLLQNRAEHDQAEQHDQRVKKACPPQHPPRFTIQQIQLATRTFALGKRKE